jgi:ribosomal protein S12 methylthiotransferase accessory factor
MLIKAHTSGTHRLFPPEVTLHHVQSQLSELGITRCADVTGLDHIGIPVFCAIRPQARLLQVANGKGVDSVSARVSALMEAAEFHYYERASNCSRRASLATMRREGYGMIEPQDLAQFRGDCFFSPDYIIDWEQGEELVNGRPIWLPSSSVRIQIPMLYPFSSNGLASGNHIIEASLHGLYELIERDAVSRLSRRGRIRLERSNCCCIDLDTVDDLQVVGLIEKVRAAQIKLILIWIESVIPVHTFWAILLERNPFGHCSKVNIGYGTHLSVSVAATRAITEAAQSRVTYIHGAREDLNPGAYRESMHQSRLFTFFDGLESSTAWQEFSETSSTDLIRDYQWVLEQLVTAGYKNILRVPLSQAAGSIPVVKMFVPGLHFNKNLI